MSYLPPSLVAPLLHGVDAEGCSEEISLVTLHVGAANTDYTAVERLAVESSIPLQ